MHRPRIGFALLSPSARPIASTRVSVLNLIPHLAAQGFEPEIAFDPDVPSEEPNVEGLADRMLARSISIAYFQKVRGSSVLAEIRKLRSNGIIAVYGVCDLVDDEMAAACDATVTVTEFLKSLYAAHLRDRIFVVHDAIERPEIRKDHSGERGARKARDPLRVVLVTGDNLQALPILGRPPDYCRVIVVGRYPLADTATGRLRMALRARTRETSMSSFLPVVRDAFAPAFRRVNWSLDAVYRELLDADVGIIPVQMDDRADPLQPVPAWQTKSENRLTLKMAIGLPVVAAPVPSYLPVVEQGVNAFIATTRDEWLGCLDALRDPELRAQMGRRARESVIDTFSARNQGGRLCDVFRRLLDSRTRR